VFPKFATSVTVADFGDRGRVVAEMGVGHASSVLQEKTVSQVYDRGISGTRLRHAALAILMSVRSCTLAEMWSFLRRRHRLDESVTRKTLADALRYECAKGRAVHDGYGRYRVGTISARTKRRILAEEREIGVQLSTDEYVDHLIGEEERRLIDRLQAERRAEERALDDETNG
jgi:hypothetical protein